jgi:hypothetical protein
MTRFTSQGNVHVKQPSIFRLLVHAKLYEELAMACTDKEMSLEFRQYAQRCIEVAKSSARLSAIANQFAMLTSPAAGLGQALH